MTDEGNKRLIKSIFGYYPVFDPKTMKKIPPKTIDERIDSIFSDLNDEDRKSIKATMAKAEKHLKRSEKLRNKKMIRIKRTGADEEYDEVELFHIINYSLDAYISDDTIEDVKLLLNKMPSILLIDADVIDDEILNDDYSVKNMSVMKFEKLIQYLSNEQKGILAIYLKTLIEMYYEDKDIMNN